MCNNQDLNEGPVSVESTGWPHFPQDDVHKLSDHSPLDAVEFPPTSYGDIDFSTDEKYALITGCSWDGVEPIVIDPVNSFNLPTQSSNDFDRLCNEMYFAKISPGIVERGDQFVEEPSLVKYAQDIMLSMPTIQTFSPERRAKELQAYVRYVHCLMLDDKCKEKADELDNRRYAKIMGFEDIYDEVEYYGGCL
jgi:hypothetical protein